MPRGVYDRSKTRKKRTNNGTEIPLEHIPDRLPTIKMNGSAHPTSVYAEYDTAADQMVLVLGKLRLPFRVR